MQGRWMYVGAGIVVALLLFFFYKKYRIAPDVNFSSVVLSDLQGRNVNLGSYKGKPLLLSFAASWCGPCMKELTELQKVRDEVDAVARIVVVSDEPAEKIGDMRARHGFTFEFLRLGSSFDSIGIHSIPTSYLFNKEGKVVKKEVGYLDWSDPGNRAHLVKLLGQ